MERKQAISPGQEAIKTISPVQEEIKAFVKAHIDSSRFNFRHDYGNSLAFDLVNGAYSIIVHPVDYNITIGKDQKPKLKSSLSVMNFEKSQGQASSTRPESREPNPMFLPGPETYLIPVFYGDGVKFLKKTHSFSSVSKYSAEDRRAMHDLSRLETQVSDLCGMLSYFVPGKGICSFRTEKVDANREYLDDIDFDKLWSERKKQGVKNESIQREIQRKTYARQYAPRNETLKNRKILRAEYQTDGPLIARLHDESALGALYPRE